MKKTCLLQKKYLLLLFVLMLQSFLTAQVAIPEDFCISRDELKLFNLINNYRRGHNLEAIPMSKNLCFVARLHVDDLVHNHPDEGNCNLHSWSDQSNWTGCCYGSDPDNNTCMTSKPRELTTYQGKGFEIAFWESLDAVPEIVLDLWIGSKASDDLLLNRNTWAEQPWKAMGVGMMKGYAVAWFGHESDEENAVKICDTIQTDKPLFDRVVPVYETTSVRYYLIISSFNERSQAEKELNALRKRGFRNPSIVPSAKNFRVSLGNYATREEALEAKKSLGEKYAKAWVLKQ